MFLSLEEKIELTKNSLSKVVFLQDDELRKVANVFLNIPFEYGVNGAVGKKYEAIKDYLKWNSLKVEVWTPIVVNMGLVWVKNLKK